MKVFALISICIAMCLPVRVASFTPSPYSSQRINNSKKIDTDEHQLHIVTTLSHATTTSRNTLLIAKATNNDDLSSDGESEGILSSINIPYALAYVAFLAYAYVRNGAEVPGASQALIEQYFSDPLNPGFNELFIVVFNLLGLYAAPLACLLMPGAKNQKLNATPFLLGSMFGGYGSLGIYASTRKPNPTSVTKSELGWFTANVLENKIFNWLIVAMFTSAYVTSGALQSFVADPAELIKGYGELFSQTALVSASSMDFVILSLCAVSFIPEDLERRQYDGNKNLVAALTLLLPGLGAALYCALRPSLDEE